MPGALVKTIAEDVAAAEALHKAGKLDEAISAYQSIESKNTRLTTVNLVLASLYREKAEQEKNPAAKQALLNRAADADNEFKKSESK